MDEKTESSPLWHVDAKSPDWALEVLIEVVNNGSGESRLSITLFTAGGTFAGKLMPSVEWAALLRERLAKFPGTAALTEGFAPISRLIAERNERDDIAVGFVHLDDAVQLRGVEWADLGLGLWRGSIFDVVGWTLGEPTRS